MHEQPLENSYEQSIASVARREYLQAERTLTELQTEADRIMMTGQVIPPELRAKIEAATQEFHRASDEWLDTSTEAHFIDDLGRGT